ncbi:hypothetical protein BHM03_00051312 [Ensete ventricosum]|nr:hypothetical protein BHM03_00051312 [Ensete ventricosum]
MKPSRLLLPRRSRLRKVRLARVGDSLPFNWRDSNSRAVTLGSPPWLRQVTPRHRQKWREALSQEANAPDGSERRVLKERRERRSPRWIQQWEFQILKLISLRKKRT